MVRAHACNLSAQELEAKHQEFKVILSFIVGSKPGWATRDLMSNRQMDRQIRAYTEYIIRKLGQVLFIKDRHPSLQKAST